MVGEKLGSFRIESTLGVGAMGVVYKATNETTGRPAAVKVILNEIAQKGKPYERFRREAEILQQFRHSNIVRFLAMGRYKGTSYFAMEYIAGETLEQILKETGAMPWREVVDLGVQLCDALHYAHEHGVVHRDLKPSNLMITKDGRVKLTDFGIAKDLDATALTATGRTLGTAAYMAPEQIRGTPEISHKTDLYALGIVFYQMLTGQAPFEGASAVQLMHSHLNGAIPRPSNKLSEIPKALDNLVVQLMAKEPAQRPWDAAAVSVSLQAIREKAERGESVQMVWSNNEPNNGSAAQRGTGAVEEVKKKSKSRTKSRNSPSNRPISGRQIAEIGGLVLMLLVVGGAIGYIVWPESEASLYQKAKDLMAKEDRLEWNRARDDYLDPLEKRFPNNSHQEEIRGWRDKIILAETEGRARVLESPVRTRFSDPTTKNEERYLEYFVLVEGDQKRHDDLKAILDYQEFVKALDPAVKDYRGWELLAGKRVESIRSKIMQRRETVNNLIERALRAKQSGNTEEADSIWKDLVDRYGQFTDLRDVLGVSPSTPPNPPPTTGAPSDSPTSSGDRGPSSS
jgi:serine/threonine protein kinase